MSSLFAKFNMEGFTVLGEKCGPRYKTRPTLWTVGDRLMTTVVTSGDSF